MRAKAIGNALLICAWVLACAGIAEPSSATFAAVSVLLFAGFVIVTIQSHEDWSAGYRDAQLDMTFSRQEARENQFSDPSPLYEGESFKCGLDGCECETNPKFREWAND